MNCQDLPIEAMLPRISICRLFDTRSIPNWASQPRVAEFYELVYYIDGGGSITINGKVHPVSPAAIRFTRPGTVLSSIPHYRSYSILFDFGTAQTLFRNPLLDGIPDFFQTDGRFLPHFKQLLEQFHSVSLTAPARCNSLLIGLLCALFDEVCSPAHRSAPVATCLKYINMNYHCPITLDTLCRLSGYSKAHLLRMFRRELGCSPHELLSSVRLRQAKLLLTETELPLSDIAERCGFASESHFKTLFRNTTGLTPGRYRRHADS